VSGDYSGRGKIKGIPMIEPDVWLKQRDENYWEGRVVGPERIIEREFLYLDDRLWVREVFRGGGVVRAVLRFEVTGWSGGVDRADEVVGVYHEESPEDQILREWDHSVRIFEEKPIKLICNVGAVSTEGIEGWGEE